MKAVFRLRRGLDSPALARGRKTEREISKPLLYLERDSKLYVVASLGGSDKAPDWYLNVVANPEVTVERRWVRGAYRARTLAPEERQEIWRRLVALYPAYADCQRRTSRTIQLVELAPV